jgi:hypothetical protein
MANLELVDVGVVQKWIGRETGESWAAPTDSFKAEGETGDWLAQMIRGTIPEDGQEHLFVMALDVHGMPLARGLVSCGTVDSCPLYPRDVFSWALAVPRVRFVGVAHNHPSGDVTPSGGDKTGTAVLAKSGQMLGIDLAWSMVVTHENDQWQLVPLVKTPDKGERTDSPEDPDSEAPEPDSDNQPEGDDSEGDDDAEGDDPGSEPEEGGVDYDSPGSDNPCPAPTQPESTADVDALRNAIKSVFKIK